MMPSLKEIIDSLPDTPDRIADHLKEQGITGLPNSPSNCPIAQLIDREVEKPEGFYSISVSRLACAIYYRKDGAFQQTRVSLYRYPSLIDFIIGFDHGRYGFLRKRG